MFGHGDTNQSVPHSNRVSYHPTYLKSNQPTQNYHHDFVPNTSQAREGFSQDSRAAGHCLVVPSHSLCEDLHQEHSLQSCSVLDLKNWRDPGLDHLVGTGSARLRDASCQPCSWTLELTLGPEFEPGNQSSSICGWQERAGCGSTHLCGSLSSSPASSL